jgi:hypothetical protein
LPLLLALHALPLYRTRVAPDPEPIAFAPRLFPEAAVVRAKKWNHRILPKLCGITTELAGQTVGHIDVQYVLPPSFPFGKPPSTTIAVVYLFPVSLSPLQALKSLPHLAGMHLNIFPHRMPPLAHRKSAGATA